MDSSRKLSKPPTDARLAELAAGQHGVISTAQLLNLGLTRNDVQYRVAAGRLHRLHRGIYAVGHPEVSREGWLLSAVLSVGPDAALSHRSAATLWGLTRHRPGPVDVNSRRRVAVRRGIRAHQTTSLPRRDVTSHLGIAVTRPPRTLLDLADVPDLPDRALRRAVREAEIRGLARPAQLRELLERSGAGRHGAHRLRRLLEAGPAPTRSELEDRTLALLAAHGLPRPLVNARVKAGGRGYEVDFLYPDFRLIVEVDGDRYHGSRLARQDDAARQADLERAGYRVVRLTWHQVVDDPQRTIARLRAVLATAAATARPAQR